MKDRKRIHAVYFKSKDLARRFQQLYYDHMPLFEMPYSGNYLGGVYSNPRSAVWLWMCSVTCTAAQ